MPPSETKPGDLTGVDSRSGAIRIDRVIPLHWVLGLIGAIALQAVLLWQGQQAQAKAIGDMASQVTTLATKVEAKNLKDIEHDLRLDEHARRINALENRKGL